MILPPAKKCYFETQIMERIFRMTKEKNVAAYIAWIFICIIWGTTYLAIRIGVKDISPALFTGLRWIAAGPVLFIILILKGYKLPPKEDLLHLSIMGIAMIGIGNGLLVFAEKYIPIIGRVI